MATRGLKAGWVKRSTGPSFQRKLEKRGAALQVYKAKAHARRMRKFPVPGKTALLRGRELRAVSEARRRARAAG